MKRIFIACACCTLAGVSAGYVGGKMFLPDGQEETRAAAENSSGSFRAGNHDRRSSSGHRSHTSFVTGNKLLDLRVKIRQGNISPEELKEEFRRLMEMDIYGNGTYRYFDGGKVMVLQELGRQWGLLAPRQALAELEKYQTDKGQRARSELLAFVLEAWAETDPEAVADYYMQNREKLAYNQTFLYLNKWAETDPEGAWCNLSSLSDFEKKNGIEPFFESVFDFNPEKAGEFMSRLDGAQWENDRFMSYAINKWSQTDKEGMDKWMAGLSAEQQDKLKPFNVMNTVAEKPEEGGMAFSSLSPEDQKRAISTMGWKLNDMEPKERIDWITKYASEDIAADWAPGYMWSYAKESPVEMHEWIEKLPEGKLRERALRQYANLDGSKEVSYASRLDLMNTLVNDRDRERAIQDTLHRWAGENPEESKKWIDRSTFTEERKKELLSFLQKKHEFEQESLYKE